MSPRPMRSRPTSGPWSMWILTCLLRILTRLLSCCLLRILTRLLSCLAPSKLALTCDNETLCQWTPLPLTEEAPDRLYLKGGPTGPKGNFHGKGAADKGKGKGKAADMGKGKAADTGKGKWGQGQEQGQEQRHRWQWRGHLSLSSGTALID